MSEIFKPMRAMPLDESKIIFPCYLSPKLDGIRAIVKDGVVRSKSMKPIPNKHVQEKFKHCEGLDGELIVGSPAAQDVVRKTTSVVMSHDKSAEDVWFYVFDCIETPENPFKERRTRAVELANRYSKVFRNVPLYPVMQILVEDSVEMERREADLLSAGFEGGMLRNPDAPYKFGTSTQKLMHLMKLKRTEDSEAEILSVFEAMENTNEKVTNELGRSKRSSAKSGKVPKDTLGGFHVKWQGVEFDIGPGEFSHEELQELWRIRETLPGQLLKFRYLTKGVLINPDGTFIPRQPIAISLRSKDDMPAED